MNLRASFLQLLHHLLRVPAPVVHRPAPMKAWGLFIPRLSPPEEPEFRHIILTPEERFTIPHRTTNTVQ